MKKRNYNLVLAVTLATVGLTLGMSAAAWGAPKPMRFERLSIDDGLSQNTVLAISQDSVGFLWVATEDGLNRYDGNAFLHYRHDRDGQPQDGLSSSYVFAVEEHVESGDLWIATDGGGVARYDRRGRVFRTFRHDPNDAGTIASDHIRDLYIDRRGIVWVATRDRGLDRIDPKSGSVAHFRHDAGDAGSLSSDELFVITGDATGQLWIGTNAGLNLFDPESGQFIRYVHDPQDPNTLAGDRVRAIHEDSSGVVWVGSEKAGLSRLDRETDRIDRYLHDPKDPTSLSHSTVRTILEDSGRRLWVGTASGLNLLDRETGTFSRYRNDPADPFSLSDDYIFSLHQDAGDVLWVGTRSGGLNKWNPRSWSFGHVAPGLSGSEGLSNPMVTSFAEDSLGRLWVGTMGGGLHRIDRVSRGYEYFIADPSDPGSISSDFVMSLASDHNGGLWVGTMREGLNHFSYKSGVFRHFRHDPNDPGSLSANAIMRLFTDREGRLWVGTFGGGISRLDRGSDRFVRFAADPEDPKALASPRVTSFAQDLTGAIWVGTDGGGLHLYQPRTGGFRRYRHDPRESDTLNSDIIYSLHVDTAGTLWIGTRGGGLSRLVGSSRSPSEVRFESFSTGQGLGNADVYGIESDGQGFIWVSTNAGLSRFDPRAEVFKNYTRSHGLQASEFNFGSHYASSSGELFFGGVNGFNMFHPSSLEENPHAPPVALTKLFINNVEVDSGSLGRLDEVRLSPSENAIAFEFAALDFADPAGNQLAFKLEGFDERWVDLGDARRISYTNLEPGDYVLNVQAANADGVWTEGSVALGLHVATPLWRTGWAYALYALAGVLVILGFVRSQQRKVEREIEYSQRLEAEVEMRTEELEERNTELQVVNHQLLEASLTDSLTGLRNRRFLFEQVAKDIAMVRRRYHDITGGHRDAEVFDLVFLMVDLDHFKSINDSCGHAAGDSVLVEIRNLLLESCRASDIVIRWGGDEFLVIARDTDPDQAATLAERIRASIESKVFDLLEGRIGRTTCSVGYSCYPFVRSQPDAVTWEQVLQFADSALYEAKKRRNAWVGFIATETTLEREGVARLIRDTPTELVEDGSLALRESEVRRFGPAEVRRLNDESASA